jgi:hypothetical protein
VKIPDPTPSFFTLLTRPIPAAKSALRRPLLALEAGSSFSTGDVFTGGKRSKFPYNAPDYSTGSLYEPFKSTLDATTTYLNTFVTPRLNAVVSSAVER